LKSFLDYFII